MRKKTKNTMDKEATEWTPTATMKKPVKRCKAADAEGYKDQRASSEGDTCSSWEESAVDGARGLLEGQPATVLVEERTSWVAELQDIDRVRQ